MYWMTETEVRQLTTDNGTTFDDFIDFITKHGQTISKDKEGNRLYNYTDVRNFLMNQAK